MKYAIYKKTGELVRAWFESAQQATSWAMMHLHASMGLVVDTWPERQPSRVIGDRDGA